MERLDLGTRHVAAEVGGGALRLRIDRVEKRNAITQDMYRALKRAAILADDRDDVDVLVLTGSGDVFAVGGDMTGVSEDPDGLAAELDPTEHFPFRHFERCRKVVLAAVNGLCYAGGLNLVLSADFAIAAEEARFRVPELLRGVPDPWAAARLPALVGVAAAKNLLFRCPTIDATEAWTMGLVVRVVPRADLDADVERVIGWIRQTAPHARGHVKEDVNRRLPVPDVPLFRRSILSPEMNEGFAAFLEKRAPRWPR